MNIGAQRCGDLLGFTCSAQPTRMLRTPERMFVYMVARKSLSKCRSRHTMSQIN